MPRFVRISSLNPAPYNPRAISPEALEGLAQSIRRFTETIEGDGVFRLMSTVTVNRNGRRIIGGHQRVRALSEVLGQKVLHPDDVSWIRCEPDSPQEKAANVALNNHLIAGEFTPDLATLLRELRDPLEGFDELRFDRLLDWAGSFSVDEVSLPELPSGERAPFQQMTFTLTDSQAEAVKAAIAAAKAAGDFGDTGNQNSNGNALARVAEAYRGES